MSYTTSQAIVCPQGSTFGYSNTSGGSFTPLATEISQIKLPSISAGEVDVTNFATLTFPVPEQKGDWGKLEEGSVEANLTAADYIAANNLIGVQGFFKGSVTKGEGDPSVAMNITFPGYVSGLDGQVAVKGLNKITIKFKPTAKPVVVAGT